MEILWWWAPAAVVTLLSVAWVSWYGRDGRGEVDRDEAVKRMAEALTKQTPEPRGTETVVQRPRNRSTGIAVRPTRSAPEPTPSPDPSPWSDTPA